MIRRHSIPMFLALVVCTMPSARGQKPTPAKKHAQQAMLMTLKRRMKKRYPQLERLRAAGKIGETYKGMVGCVSSKHAQERLDPKDPKKGTVGGLIASENKDRLALYAILARALKTTPAKVAIQNGIRNLRKAKPTDWFQLQSGKWVQRKNIKKREKKPKGA